LAFKLGSGWRPWFLITVVDPDPGSDHFLSPGSGIWKPMGNKTGCGMNILDHVSESLETIFWGKILKFFYADPDPGSFALDPG
jgi:hypothetical protein